MDVAWKKTKPKPKGEFILITATFIAGYWDYKLFTIQKTDGYNNNDEPCWYYGVFCSDGDEWGDYSDLVADKYLTMPSLKPKPPQS